MGRHEAHGAPHVTRRESKDPMQNCAPFQHRPNNLAHLNTPWTGSLRVHVMVVRHLCLELGSQCFPCADSPQHDDDLCIGSQRSNAAGHIREARMDRACIKAHPLHSTCTQHASAAMPRLPCRLTELRQSRTLGTPRTTSALKRQGGLNRRPTCPHLTCPPHLPTSVSSPWGRRSDLRRVPENGAAVCIHALLHA